MNEGKSLKIKNKVIAAILLAITILSNISTVFAASGEGEWIGTQYPSYYQTTETSSIGICLRKLVNTQTNESITAFCAEHGKEFYSGVKNTGNYYTPTNEQMKKACKIAYLGWYSKYGTYVVNDEVVKNSMDNLRLDYAFTQQYIWEVIGQTSATFVSSSVQEKYNEFKSNIDNQLASYEQKPSFDNLVELNAGETKSVNDNNGVLQQYPNFDTTIEGVRFTHAKGENHLTITVSAECNVESLNITEDMAKSLGIIKEGTEDNDTTIYFDITDEKTQDQLYALHYNSPIGLEISLKINLFGNIEITKTNENNELIDGSVFKITNDNGFEQEVTIKSGKAVIQNLSVGTYYVQEISAPEGYVLNTEKYQVEVTSNKTTTQLVINERPKGKIIIDKSITYRADMDKSIVNIKDLSGIQFKLTAKEDIIDQSNRKVIYKKGQEVKTYNLNKTGKLEINNLPMGTYEIQEIKTLDGLVLDNTKHEVKFTQKDNTTKVYKETLELTNETTVVEFSKKDITGDKELEGATLTVYDEEGNIIDTWISGTETHFIEGLVVGNTYTLREDLAPLGYVKSTDIEFTIKNTNEMQHVTMVDKIVEIIKTDITTGEELEGAELKVVDEEGNEVDSWISTKEPHKVIGLEEGKTYKLIEITAPYGYETAEEITFTVTDDKETQKIEMKDKPIINTPKTGDHRNTIFYVIALGISALGIIVLSIKKYKKEKDNK